MGYWELVEPIWDDVSIHDGPEAFLRQFAAAPHTPRTLLAAHWTDSEVCNGGFHQYFSNSTGVLAPEAVAAFRLLGMPRTAATIEQAMSFFGAPYPREREARQSLLGTIDRRKAFRAENDSFFELIEKENGGFEAAADAYARPRLT